MSMPLAPERPPVAASADWRALLAGARAMVPLLVAVAPFGLVFGVTLAETGLPQLAGWSLSWLVYGGSAQLAAVGLLAGGASAIAVVATVAVINLRLALYSATLAPHWQGTSKPWRAAAAYLVVDPSFVVGTQSYDGSRPPRAAHRHYLGGALLLWVGWQGLTAVGMTVGAALPPGLQLDFVAPLYLVALVVPAARTTTDRVAVGVAIAATGLAALLPLHLGPAVGMVAGLGVASVLRRRS